MKVQLPLKRSVDPRRCCCNVLPRSEMACEYHTCSCAATLFALIEEMAGKLRPPMVANRMDRNA